MQLDSISMDSAIITIRNSLLDRLERSHYTSYRFYELLNSSFDSLQVLIDKLADLNGVAHKSSVCLPDLELLVDTSTGHNIQDVGEIVFSHSIICTKYDDIHRQELSAYEIMQNAFQELTKLLKDQEDKLNETIKHALKAIKRLSHENKELQKGKEIVSNSKIAENQLISYKAKHKESTQRSKENQDKVQDLIKENSSLRQEISKYDKIIEELEEKNLQISQSLKECTIEKDTNSIKLNHMHELYEELMKKYAGFEESYDKLLRENTDLKEEIEFKMSLDEEYTKELEKYENRVRYMTENLQITEESSMKFKSYYEDFSDKYLKLQETYTFLKQEHSDLTSELAKYKDLYKELDEKCHNLDFQTQLNAQEKENIQNTNFKLVQKLESFKTSLHSRNELKKQNKYLREKLEELSTVAKDREDLKIEVNQLYNKLHKYSALKEDRDTLKQQNNTLRDQIQTLEYSQRHRRTYRDLSHYIGISSKGKSENEMNAYSNLMTQNEELKYSENSLKEKICKLEADINWLVEQLAENAHQSRQLEQIVDDQMRSSYMKQAVLLRRKDDLSYKI